MGNIIFLGLLLLALGLFGLYTGWKDLQRQKAIGVTGKLKKGKSAVTGVIGPVIVILVGLLLLYIAFQGL